MQSGRRKGISGIKTIIAAVVIVPKTFVLVFGLSKIGQGGDGRQRFGLSGRQSISLLHMSRRLERGLVIDLSLMIFLLLLLLLIIAPFILQMRLNAGQLGKIAIHFHVSSLLKEFLHHSAGRNCGRIVQSERGGFRHRGFVRADAAGDPLDPAIRILTTLFEDFPQFQLLLRLELLSKLRLNLIETTAALRRVAATISGAVVVVVCVTGFRWRLQRHSQGIRHVAGVEGTKKLDITVVVVVLIAGNLGEFGEGSVGTV